MFTRLDSIMEIDTGQIYIINTNSTQNNINNKKVVNLGKNQQRNEEIHKMKTFTIEVKFKKEDERNTDELSRTVFYVTQ